MTEEEKTEEKASTKKEHVCTVCGKVADATICQACEEKIRGEAFEKKRVIEKS
ncbi:MAG: hypothetical protein KAT46_07750 [Deltaproteobacteria bacterium]|nr:hypothetical protein [Deltaproteobacteria bacterium]